MSMYYPEDALGILARSPTDIPGVRIVGAILGILLVAAAIRAMFGKRR
jgi:hypothetical protein